MANKGLGRGLDSLIPQKPKKAKYSSAKQSSEEEMVVDVLSEEDKNKVFYIDPEKIEANEMQPRKYFSDSALNELMDSIRTYGIIQPLVVIKKDKDKYELIAGERRLRSSQRLGLREVPVIVRDFDQQKKLEVSLVENLQREDLNPVEKALAYRKLIDEFNLTVNEMAKRVGKSRPVISNNLRMLGLPEEIQEALMKGTINEGHANLLTGLDTEVKQLNVFRKIVNGNLSVRGAKKEVQDIGGTKSAKIVPDHKDKERENDLRGFLGNKVEIKRTTKGGRLIIDFYSDEELDNLIKKIKRK
ncbi:MAG TPA: ParB/RepB/Spo0J family partition protein [Patescibacteria group bacterium]|nr:ParB/RepB/Spo0J family partition protein [Patescibacteria group bacterium]